MNNLTNNHFEKVITIAVNLVSNDTDTDFSLAELERLVNTAGGVVIKSFVQKMVKFNPTFLIGYGKLEEIKNFIEQNDVDTIVFDDTLSPAQIRNIEDFLDTKIKVLDRTHLILDIFALHAKTKESKLQIELAQLEYTLPRLKGKGIELSRQSAGIGTRGPGEQKLETDSRKIKDRISKIKDELCRISSSREINRQMRKKNKIPMIAIVGYTNAGKSTLLKTLTEQDIYTEDKLFATLDTQIKRFELPNSQKVLLLDTVGFVQKLPHELVMAFRSTLEEIKEADLILHLIDLSIAHYEYQRQAVLNVLKEIGCDEKKLPILDVYNKIDLLNDKETISSDLITISAKETIGFKRLFFEIINVLNRDMKNIVLKIPYSDTAIIERIYEEGILNSKDYQDGFVLVNADVQPDLYEFLRKYEGNVSG